MKEIISTSSAPEPKVPLSQAVRAGGLIFVSGQVPIDAATGKLVEGGTGPQTEQVLRNIKQVLQAAGCSMDNVVKVTAYLKDIQDFDEFNESYRLFFNDGFPARSTVGGIELAGPFRVEIDAVAVSPEREGET
jgi:2-iminobutanoate/2-iminopropanoate deaminase